MAFLKVDLELVRNRTISKDAILLYSYLAGLKELSEKNNVRDKSGTVVVYFTLEQTMELLGLSKPTVLKVFRELENNNYIKRVKRGLGKASYIYVNPIENEKEVAADLSGEAKQEKDGAELKVKSQDEYQASCISTNKKTDQRKEDFLKHVRTEKYKSNNMESILVFLARKKKLNITQNAFDCILDKIRNNNYRISNIYSYLSKCLDNYFQTYVLKNIDKNFDMANRAKSIGNKFCNFEQRDYSDEEMEELTRKMLQHNMSNVCSA